MGAIHSSLFRLALAVAAAQASCALASQAAQVQFATNEPVIVSADGRERPARKGEAIVPGERVLTRAGRAQLAFTDGAFVSLQPNTDFGVTEYHFNGGNDGKEKSVLSLVKGALRTITGLIGRSKRDAYVMQTPTATIGIRGTGGRIEVNEQGTFVAGTSGTWFMSTPGGTVDIPAGRNGFAGPNNSEPPRLTGDAPNTPPAGSNPPPGFVASDQVGAGGAAAVIPPPFMADGPGYHVLHTSTLGYGALYGVSPSTVTFANGLSVESYTDSVSQIVARGTTSLQEFGNDGVVGWGRWAAGEYTIAGSPQYPIDATMGLYYVVGIPTANMPTEDSASYSLLGATRPTEISGGSLGTFSLNAFSVNFLTSTFSINFDVSVNGYGFNAYTTAGMVGPGNKFSESALTVTGFAGGACLSSCSGSLEGAFYGNAAARAGMIYSLSDSLTEVTVIGSAAFKKNP